MHIDNGFGTARARRSIKSTLWFAGLRLDLGWEACLSWGAHNIVVSTEERLMRWYEMRLHGTIEMVVQLKIKSVWYVSLSLNWSPTDLSLRLAVTCSRYDCWSLLLVARCPLQYLTDTSGFRNDWTKMSFRRRWKKEKSRSRKDVVDDPQCKMNPL